MDINLDLAVEAAKYSSVDRRRVVQAQTRSATLLFPQFTMGQPAVGKRLEAIMGLQTFYHDEKIYAHVDSVFEQSHEQALLYEVSNSVKKAEQALVKNPSILFSPKWVIC